MRYTVPCSTVGYRRTLPCGVAPGNYNFYLPVTDAHHHGMIGVAPTFSKSPRLKTSILRPTIDSHKEQQTNVYSYLVSNVRRTLPWATR